MSSDIPATGLQLRSLVKASGELELSLVPTPIPDLGDDEILVRVEGAPVNPSDLGLLLGPALIGFVADFTSLPVAFVLVAAMLAVIAIGAGRATAAER